ncbi:hypothetical protein IAR55_005672 [Kwoniella newhampshirensis]|uniref:CUE domain-containing protein n=1 Tax=Kwoniella newhampshirensis TaxID=1651941 RepID=A0AAW0YSP6_9TREE
MTTSTLPSAVPSPALYPTLLPLLLTQISHSSANAALLPILQTTLHILSSIRLSPASSTPIPGSRSTIPLQALVDLSSSHPSLIKAPLLIDAILAYPLYTSTAINEILYKVFEQYPDLMEIFRIDVLPSLLIRLKSESNNVTQIEISARILLSMIRAHEELVDLVLEDSKDLLRALTIAYSILDTTGAKKGLAKSEQQRIIGIKSDIIMICQELISRVGGQGASSEAMLRFMGEVEGGQAGRGLRSDWESVFGSDARGLDAEVKNGLEMRRDEEAKQDLRVRSILPLFPTLPPHLLLSALSHSHFASLPSGSRATPSEQAAPLLEAILNGGDSLPDDLNELKVAVRNMAGDEPAAVEQRYGETDIKNSTYDREERKKVDRKNIWNDEELDLGRLKLKDDDSALPTLSTAIPDHLRASIMRLVESQALEEDERRRALKEANLLDDDDDDLLGADDDDAGVKGLKVGDGDSEDGDELGEEDGVKISRQATSAGQSRSSRPSDRQRLDLLRSTYIANPKIFERDGVTRRSEERKKLRSATGWDDGQIEGWKIMLDRDPHKEAILAAHGERASGANKITTSEKEASGSRSASGSARGGKRGGGRGGGGRGGARGGGNGGRGGGSGGKESKSSRGHSNAARTRGHDRKMRGMGAV